MAADQQVDLAGPDVIGQMAKAEVRLSDQLLEARATLCGLSGFPGTPPSSLEKAYAVQNRSIGQWPDAVAGWKVGGIPANLRQELGAEWLVGPIFSRNVRYAPPDETIRMPIFADGFAAIEPEFVIMLGASRDEDRMFIGAEIASSPVPAINDFGPTAVVCDFGNNNGVVVGQEVLEWAKYDRPVEVSIWIDGELIGTRNLDDLSESALSARDFCIAHAERQSRPLAPGTLISTGAITGVHEAKLGARSRIAFAGLGGLELELISETALR